MLNNGIEKNQMYDFRRLLFWGGKGLQNIQNFTADSKHLNIRRSVLNLMEGVRQQRLLCFTGDLSYSSWGRGDWQRGNVRVTATGGIFLDTDHDVPSPEMYTCTHFRSHLM